MFLRKYKNLYKFKKYVMKYKKAIMLLRVVMLLASSLGMLLPYFTSKRLIAVNNIDAKSVVVCSVIIMSIIVFHHIFWYLWEKIGSKLNNNIAMDIRKDIISSMMNTKYNKIKANTSGYYLERINDDVLEVSSFYYYVMSVLTDSITNISFLIFIFCLNYQCGLIFLSGILFLYIIDLIKLKKDIKYTEQLKHLNEKFNSKTAESYRGIKDIKGLGVKNEVIKNFNIINQKLVKVQIQKDKTILFYSRIKTFSQHLIETILFAFAILYLIPRNAITVITLLTIINYSGFMYDLVGFFAMLKDYYVRGEFKAKRILEIMTEDNFEVFGNFNEDLNKYSIRVKNLSYSYEDGKNTLVLDKINFKITPKTVNVFIGSSGSGKSTLFAILSKLLQCENDKVYIGNKDINDLSEQQFKNNVCIVNQDPFLLNDTLLNNIKIVKPSASLEEIEND